jgi:hypothetical protein
MQFRSLKYKYVLAKWIFKPVRLAVVDADLLREKNIISSLKSTESTTSKLCLVGSMENEFIFI